MTQLQIEILELFSEAQHLGRRYRIPRGLNREPVDLRTEHFSRQGVELPLRGIVRPSFRGLSNAERARIFRQTGLRPADLRR